MRKHHEGTVFQRQTGPEKGRWVATISTPAGRRSKVCRTREDAETALVTLRRANPPYHLDVTVSTASFSDLISRHLAWAAAEGWGRERTAAIMAVSLTSSRIKFGICGPCVYCGTPYASTVDHVIPQMRGGTDSPDNLVSACLSCNSAKGSSAIGDFLARKVRQGAAPTAVEPDLHVVEDMAS